MPKLKPYIPGQSNKTTLDTILEHLTGERKRKLSVSHQKMLDRWKVAEKLLRKHPKASTVCKLLQAEFEYSQPTALSDIRNARRLFGSLLEVDTDFERLIAIEQMKKAAKKALKAELFKEFVSIRKELNRLMGLYEHEGGLIDPSMLQSNTFIFQLGGRKEVEMSNLSNVPVEVREAAADNTYSDYIEME